MGNQAEVINLAAVWNPATKRASARDIGLGRFLQRDPNGTALTLLTAVSMNGQGLSILADGFDAPSLYGDGFRLSGSESGGESGDNESVYTCAVSIDRQAEASTEFYGWAMEHDCMESTGAERFSATATKLNEMGLPIECAMSDTP